MIVSGPGTGAAPDLEEAARLRRAVPDATIVVGSGASAATLGALAEVVDGAIVGSSLKSSGRISNHVDPERARDLVRAAALVGWVG